MEELSKDMIGALNNKAYVIGGLNIPESVIITWCIMAFSGHSINPFHEKFKDCSI